MDEVRRVQRVQGVKVTLEFTPDEIRILEKSCLDHYDLTCKSLARQGGFIYGLVQILKEEPGLPITRDYSLRDINLLCKVLEMTCQPWPWSVPSNPDALNLRWQLTDAFQEANERQRALNESSL